MKRTHSRIWSQCIAYGCLLLVFLTPVSGAQEGYLRQRLTEADFNRWQQVDDLVSQAQWQQARERIAQWQSSDDENTLLKALGYTASGEVAMQLNEHERAQDDFERALSIYRQLNEPLLEAHSLTDIGRNYRYQSDYIRAIEYHQQALTLFEDLQDRKGVAMQNGNLGVVYELLGQYDKALSAFKRSLTLSRQLEDAGAVADDLYNIGEIYRDLGQWESALVYFTDTLALDQSRGNKKDIAYSHMKLANVYIHQASLEQARQHAEQALALFTELSTPRDKHWAMATLAHIRFMQGETESARAGLIQILRQAEQNQWRGLQTETTLLLAELTLAIDEPVQSLRYIDAGIQQARQRGELRRIAQLLGLRAQAYEAMAEYQQAYQALKQQRDQESVLFDRDKADALAAHQARSEMIRQEQTIALLRKDKLLRESEAQRQRLVWNIIWATAVVLVLLAFLLWKRWQSRRLNKLLSHQVKTRTKELEEANQALENAYKQMEQASLTDPLTGFGNRRFLQQHLPMDIETVQRHYADHLAKEKAGELDLCCFLLDIDHFKRVNDTYGHQAGDEVIRGIANALRHNARDSDYTIRWGGEEFMLVSRFVSRDEAPIMAERLRRAIEQCSFSVPRNPDLRVTCSIGYACFPLFPTQPKRVHWDKAVELADHCLYAVKASGRNGWIGVTGDTKPGLTLAGITNLTVMTSMADLNAIQWHTAADAQIR